MQIEKIGINNYAREKTPKNIEESALNFFKARRKKLLMMKNSFVLMVIKCLAELDIIQMTKKCPDDVRFQRNEKFP